MISAGPDRIFFGSFFSIKSEKRFDWAPIFKFLFKGKPSSTYQSTSRDGKSNRCQPPEVVRVLFLCVCVCEIPSTTRNKFVPDWRRISSTVSFFFYGDFGWKDLGKSLGIWSKKKPFRFGERSRRLLALVIPRPRMPQIPGRLEKILDTTGDDSVRFCRAPLDVFAPFIDGFSTREGISADAGDSRDAPQDSPPPIHAFHSRGSSARFHGPMRRYSSSSSSRFSTLETTDQVLRMPKMLDKIPVPFQGCSTRARSNAGLGCFRDSKDALKKYTYICHRSIRMPKMLDKIPTPLQGCSTRARSNAGLGCFRDSKDASKKYIFTYIPHWSKRMPETWIRPEVGFKGFQRCPSR